jgi:hypothetical protein
MEAIKRHLDVARSELDAALALLVQSQSVAPPVNIIDQLQTNEDAEWPFPNWERPVTNIRYITIHHSAGRRATTNIQYWHRLHTQSKSWSRVGYHFGIGMFRPGEAIGLYQMNELTWHTWHDARNYDTVGVCIAGDLRDLEGKDVRPNDAQIDGFGRLMAWLVPKLPNLAQIVGHSRFGRTACQGDMEVWMGDLITSARGYGQEIEPLVSYAKVGAVTQARFAVAAILPNRPPLSAYDEHQWI